MSTLIDLTGQRFGRLTVVRRAPNAPNSRQARWYCSCDCGGMTIVFGSNLRTRHRTSTRSCGCLRWEAPPKAGRAVWQREYVKDRTLHGPRTVPILGTKRRLEALQAQGWSLWELQRRLGTSCKGRLSHMLRHQTHVRRSTAKAVAQMYDQLWDVQPQCTSGYQRAWLVRNKNRAARLGYAPPAAWDDDEIDDPNAKPKINPGHSWRYVKRGKDVMPKAEVQGRDSGQAGAGQHEAA